MITVARHLSHYHRLCASYEGDRFLKKFFVKELVGRVVSLGAACLFHAEAVSRAVKICFWVIREVSSHLEDPWLTIPWLEREKDELKKTYGDSLYSFAETIYPCKLSDAETVSRSTEPVSTQTLPELLVLSLGNTPRPGVRAPSPELIFERTFGNPGGPRRVAPASDVFEAINVTNPDGQQNFRASRTPSAEDVELMDPNAQRYFRASRTPSAEDVELMDPNAQIMLRDTLVEDAQPSPRKEETAVVQIHRPPQLPTDPISTVILSKPIVFPRITRESVQVTQPPVVHIQPPLQISTDPIHVITPSEPIVFPKIAQASSEIAPLRVIHIHQPPRVSTPWINVKLSHPILFPSISFGHFHASRARSPEWERVEVPPLPLKSSASTMHLERPSSTTMHTASSGEWSDLGSPRKDGSEQNTPHLDIHTPPTDTSTGRSTASIVSRMNAGPFQPVLTTPRVDVQPPQS